MSVTGTQMEIIIPLTNFFLVGFKFLLGITVSLIQQNHLINNSSFFIDVH